MKRLVYRRQAERDLLEIINFVATESGSVRQALGLERRLRERMRRIATPGLFGRSREELGANVRSVAEPPYVIFFQYEGESIEVIRVVHGARDIDAVFDQ